MLLLCAIIFYLIKLIRLFTVIYVLKTKKEYCKNKVDKKTDRPTSTHYCLFTAKRGKTRLLLCLLHLFSYQRSDVKEAHLHPDFSNFLWSHVFTVPGEQRRLKRGSISGVECEVYG